MRKQEININSFEKNLPKFMELVIKGDEIILTKSDVPIAKITPMQPKIETVATSFAWTKIIQNERVRKADVPENWFG